MNWEWVDAVGHIFSHQAVLWSAASIGHHVTKLPQTSFEMEMLTTKWWSWSLEGCLILGNWNVTKKRISFLIWDPEKSSHLKIRKVFQTNFLFPSNKILLQFKVFQLVKWQLQFYQWLIWPKMILTLGIPKDVIVSNVLGFLELQLNDSWQFHSISNHYILKFEFHLFNYS